MLKFRGTQSASSQPICDVFSARQHNNTTVRKAFEVNTNILSPVRYRDSARDETIAHDMRDIMGKIILRTDMSSIDIILSKKALELIVMILKRI